METTVLNAQDPEIPKSTETSDIFDNPLKKKEPNQKGKMWPKSIITLTVLLLVVTYACSMAVNSHSSPEKDVTESSSSSTDYEGAAENDNDPNSNETTDSSTTETENDAEDGSTEDTTTDDTATVTESDSESDSESESASEDAPTAETDATTSAEATSETPEPEATTEAEPEPTTTTTTERILTAEEIRLTAILDDTNTTIQSTKLGLYKQKTQLSLNFLNTVISLLQNIHKNMTDLLSSSSDPAVSFATYKEADDNIENQLSLVETQMDKNRDLLQKYMVAYKDTEQQLKTVHTTLGNILLPGFSPIHADADHSG